MKHAHRTTLVATTLGLALVLSAAAPAQDEAAGGGDELAAARAMVDAGRAKQAVAALKDLLGSPGGDGAGAAKERDIRVLLAEAQIAAGDADQAVETITPLAENGDYQVLLATGRAYKAYGDQMQREERSSDDVGFAYDEARSYLEQATKKASSSESGAAIELGNLELYTLGDHAAALGRAEKLLQADAQDAEARLLRGCALLWGSIGAAQGGDEEEAGKIRKRAIEDLVAAEQALPKTRPEPWAQLAWLYETDGQPEQAVEAAVAALDRTPEGSIATLFHLALRYARERRYDIAAAALAAMVKADARQVTDAIRAEPDPTAAAVELSYAVLPMIERQAVTEARDALAAIVASRPQSADPWNNYALLCRDTQKYEESLEGYQQALSFQPESARLNNDAGVILHYYLHREYDQAQEYYEKAVELADAGLAAAEITDEARADLQLARTDAIANLKQLAEGDYTWP